MAEPTNDPGPRTGAHAVIADALASQAAVQAPIDPARRPDVLFRKRRPEGQQVSAWWMVGAFLAVSAVVIVLFSFVPGGA
ncbi:UDP-N-acetylmuramyl pentapeptide phosphotransferase [Microbacterium sp. SORGH_AS_0888]|uniref:UDP-N-acetylmuramyl pentapeptide phosphotransferase n=1 Tax=Microbacterium sp. SORGH_AS_0888 TaxID=3041791 RepID=UPI0027863AF1|nr:UDP-N-acetylmuramyl pentapeptide phosphotransferase [Microbacterium sp. SORGH_AS_0888]MDQ1128133.1 hypothetical protein [Microbacterium sp. SORGH_AS_0888]